MVKVSVALFILLLILASCADTHTENKKEILFFNVTTTQDFKTYISDSFKMDEIKHHHLKDTLLEQFGFEVDGKWHWINLFTNHPYEDVDGGYLSFELDTLGIIYSKSTTWISYSRLKSTNDSVNDLITKAFENIILNEKFHTIDLSEIRGKMKTVTFLPAKK